MFFRLNMSQDFKGVITNWPKGANHESVMLLYMKTFLLTSKTSFN